MDEGQAEKERIDFFISYNKADRTWAEWIEQQLKDSRFTTVMQARDFPPGTNFIVGMHEAASIATRSIAVLSPDYLAHAPYSQAEWCAALVQDPASKGGTLLPVRVRECIPLSSSSP